MKIQVTMPQGTKISEIAAMARAIGCRVKAGPNGTLHFEPTAVSNANVVRMPRYRRQNLHFREHD